MSAQSIFERAAARIEGEGLSYAGAVTAQEAHWLREAGLATILDVRTRSEYEQVGHVEGTALIEWRADGQAGADPRRFLERLAATHAADATILLICRSGVRSHHAAELAARAGFKRVYNVLGGFEQAWRPAGLPWTRG